MRFSAAVCGNHARDAEMVHADHTLVDSHIQPVRNGMRIMRCWRLLLCHFVRSLDGHGLHLH